MLVCSWLTVVALPLVLLVSWLYLCQGNLIMLPLFLLIGYGILFLMKRNLSDAVLHLDKKKKA
jgi:hypothetical protein